MHGTIKSRTKVMRGLYTLESAKLFMAGWLAHYNFFRPRMSLRDKTPAQVAGISFPFRNWKDICEQPYEKTARIKLVTRPIRVSTPTPRISKRTPRLSSRKVFPLGGIYTDRSGTMLSRRPHRGWKRLD
jgi:hypothetical protein